VTANIPEPVPGFRVCLQADGPNEPWQILDRLLLSHEELADLSALLDADVRLAFVMRETAWRESNREVLGMCFLPAVQGKLRPFFEWLLETHLGYMPGFLIVLNDGWWQEASPVEREVLLFHELLHAGQRRDAYGELCFNRQTDEPILALIPHDLEEFNAVVQRYGAWKPDVAAFLAAAAEGPGVTRAQAPRFEPEPLESAPEPF
jgi:hypothetical protein